MKAYTSDGIPRKDWEKVHELSLDLVNAEAKGEDPELAVERLFGFLAELEVKFGRKPSILATRADFNDDVNTSIELLLEAYKLAEAVSDISNQWLVAESLFDIYTDQVLDQQQALHWLGVLNHLSQTHAFNENTLSDYIKAIDLYKKLWGVPKRAHGGRTGSNLDGLLPE